MKIKLTISVLLTMLFGLSLVWVVSASGPSKGEDTGSIELNEQIDVLAVGEPQFNFRYVETFGVTEQAYISDTTHLNTPDGLFVDAGDNLWVAERKGGRVLKYNSSGVFQLAIGRAGFRVSGKDTFSEPSDLALDGSGNIWVADRGPNRVVKFDASGNYQSQLGVDWEEGTDNAHFKRPRSVAFDSAGRLYVADTENHRIQIFDSSGVYSATLGITGSSGIGNNQFDYPVRVAVDSSGNLYVADSNNHRIQRFRPSGATMVYSDTLGMTGVSGTSNNQFNYPYGLDLDSSDNLYIADGGNHRVQIFDKNFNYIATLGATGICGSSNSTFCWPQGVAIDSAGNIYVGDLDNHRVQKFNSSRVYQATIGVTGVPYVTGNGYYNEPNGVAVDSAGNIILTERGGNRLVKLNAAGTVQWTVGEAGVWGSDNNHFGGFWDGPTAVAVDSSSNAYIADPRNHRVQKCTSGGSCTTFAGVSGTSGSDNTHFNDPYGVALDAAGNVYVADRDNHRIQKCTLAGSCSALAGVTGVSGSDNSHFNGPMGVAVDSAGNVFVADGWNNRVQKCTSAGVCNLFVGTTGESGDDFSHFSEPRDVAVDAQGRVYVADAWNNRVQVFDSAGTYLTTIGGDWGSNIGQLRGVLGIEVDSSGNVYVTDQNNARVQKFAPGVPGWEQVNVNGFGDRDNWAAWSLFTFNNALYVSTGNHATGAEVWRASSPWEQVVSGGFGDSSNVAVDWFAEFNGYLYAGTWNDNGAGGSNGGQIWRSPTGNSGSWERVVNNGFNDPTNSEIMTLTSFNGYLYAGTWSYNTGVHGAEIWRSSTGNNGSWTRVVSNGFNGDSNNYAILSFEVFNNYLYAATGNGNTGGEIWRSSDGTTWTQVNPDGFNTSNNTRLVSLEVFNGQLYAGTWNSTGGGEVWRTTNGTNWNRVVSGGFGNGDNSDIASLVAFDGYLYAIVGNFNTGPEVWRSSTGDKGSWEKVSGTGFGGGRAAAVDWDNVTAVLGEDLYVGAFTWGNGGGRVWKTGKERVYLPILIRSSSSGQQLGTPTLLNPPAGSTQAKSAFDWTDVPGATGYLFQLSTSSAFDNLAVNQTVTSSQFVFTSYLSGAYYWRVRTLGAGGAGPYTVARSIQLVIYNADDDGDSLWNGWELHGYDANSDGTIDVNLPALGASYRHKDIFVEMDYMVRASATNGLGPNQAVLDSIVAAFNDAPVSNPDGVGGITIHLDLDDQVPYDDDLNPAYDQFIALKNTYFDLNRTAVYHYMIWANKYGGGTSSGYSFGLPATDFIVTLGGWNGGAGGTDYEKIGTFIHELGHNLDLAHGGNDHVNYKPNYLSVMNYLFQTWGVYRNGSWYNFDYQRFSLPALDETSLNEAGGLSGGSELTGYATQHRCPGGSWPVVWADLSIDWNCDGDTGDTGIAVDINGDGSNSILGSQDNWANLVFNGGGIIGSGLSPQVLAEQSKSTYVAPQLDELTYEQQLELDRLLKRAPAGP